MHRGCSAFAALALVACRSPGVAPIAEAASAPAGTALVELFTSEGCSSCPPADAVLANLARTNRSVYALAFHVDYWNELGWPDRFSSPEFTARQRRYAAAFGEEGMFTPQMIVNGLEQFTGSDRARADESIGRALAHAPTVPLSLRARATEASLVTVDYQAPDAPVDAVIDVAIVERSAATEVRGGENSGRTLRHANVVRTFFAALVQASGSVVVRVPASVRRDNGEVIACVQHPATNRPGLPVLGCARAALPP
jgi:hypothetical protein